MASPPPLHDVCLPQAVGVAVGYTSGVLPEPTAIPTAQMNAASSRRNGAVQVACIDVTIHGSSRGVRPGRRGLDVVRVAP